MRRFIPVPVLLAAAVGIQIPSTPAAAETEFVFTGGGFGHGGGMGQYGASGAADSGMSYTQILTHFYKGTTVAGRTMPSSIRVGLEQDRDTISLNGSGKFEFHIDDSVVHTASSGGAWTVKPTSGGAYELAGPGGGRTVGSAGKLLEIRFAEFGTILTVSGRRYDKEWLEIRSYRTSEYVLRAVLHLKPFERYVYGISEVPSSWPMEALKAQAVAARTYALEKMTRMGVRAGCGCHMLDDTRDQVFAGYEKIAGPSGDRWKAAVDATAGQVVLYDGRPIQALYHSSTGGHSENNEYIWRGTALPYLRGVGDPWDAGSPNHTWTVRFERQELGRKLATSSATAVGDLHSIVLQSPFGVSGRVTPVRSDGRGGAYITGSSGSKKVDGERLRSVIGLRSTLFSIDQQGLVHPDGTLLQASGGVWLLRDGTLVRVGSGVLGSAWRGSEIVRVSQATLDQYSVGHAGFRAGSLIRSPDGKVWIISDGLRRHIVSGDVLDDLGYDRGVIRNATSGETALHPEGASVRNASVHPNGTLLKGSSAAVYFMDNGRRRHIPSANVFASQFRRDEIVTVPDSTLSRYSTGQPVGFRDGTLIRTPDDKVWIVSNGLRRHIGSGQVLSSLGYSRDVIRDVSDSEAGLHQVGSPLTSHAHADGTLLQASGPVWVLRGGSRVRVSSGVLASAWRGSEVIHVSAATLAQYPEGAAGFRAGSLIRSPDNKVWIISDGLRRHIVSGAVFDDLGYNGSVIRNASSGETALHREGPQVRSASIHPNGTLLKGTTPAVYFLDGGRRRHVPTANVLASQFRRDEVVTVSEATLARYSTGAALGFRDGTLIRTPDDKVWIISNGLRRHIVSGQVLSSLGYDRDVIRDASDEEAGLHQVGPRVV